MTDEHELWACAAEVLNQHGDSAPNHIAIQIGRMVTRGDMPGVQRWKAIAKKLDALQNRMETLQ